MDAIHMKCLVFLAMLLPLGFCSITVNQTYVGPGFADYFIPSTTIYSVNSTENNITNNITNNIMNNITSNVQTVVQNVTAGHTNTIENIGLFSLLIILLYTGTYMSQIKVLGVFASMLLLIMGIWIAIDGVYMKTGELVGANSGMAPGNLTNGTVSWSNQTSTDLYSPIEIPVTAPYATFGNVVGLALILLSMYGMIHYGMKVISD